MSETYTSPAAAAQVGRTVRRLVTPEGVDLGVRLADVSQRFGALCLDLLIMIASLIVGAIFFAIAGVEVGGIEGAYVTIQLFAFLVRNFYFMLFEMGSKAATPGKRALGIRVASRTSPQLTASAVFARNALREIELFIPLSVMMSGGSITGQSSAVDGWIWLAAVVWLMIFALFPLMNKDRLRIGDLVAGTWVVRAPKPVLLPDMSATAEAASGQFTFTPEQLNAYGIAELHVLEDVLRVRDSDVMREVAERIAVKIGWTNNTSASAESFLKSYYAQLRGRLESGLLMGKRRADKHDVG